MAGPGETGRAFPEDEDLESAKLLMSPLMLYPLHVGCYPNCMSITATP